MWKLTKKSIGIASLLGCTLILTACAGSSTSYKHKNAPFSSEARQAKSQYKASLSDPIMAISRLSEHQQEWKGTRYRLGGTTKRGVDCSGFTQLTYRELFGINLPRMTVDQAKAGRKIAKSQLRTGDLVFFNTGRGPNGKHVGIYVKGDQFLHASTRGGLFTLA